MRFVLLVVTASALLSLCRGEASGCFTVEGWKGEDGCSSRLFCDIGSRCSDKTGPMCKFGLDCPPLPTNCAEFVLNIARVQVLQRRELDLPASQVPRLQLQRGVPPSPQTLASHGLLNVAREQVRLCQWNLHARAA